MADRVPLGKSPHVATDTTAAAHTAQPGPGNAQRNNPHSFVPLTSGRNRTLRSLGDESTGISSGTRNLLLSRETQ